MIVLKMCGLQIRFCLFTFRPIALKQLNSLTKMILAVEKLCKGKASDLGARGPGFNSRLWQGFLCFSFCFVVVVFLHFLSKTQYVSRHVVIPFGMLIHLV